jgi:hypothetical protein
MGGVQAVSADVGVNGVGERIMSALGVYVQCYMRECVVGPGGGRVKKLIHVCLHLVERVRAYGSYLNACVSLCPCLHV